MNKDPSRFKFIKSLFAWKFFFLDEFISVNVHSLVAQNELIPALMKTDRKGANLSGPDAFFILYSLFFFSSSERRQKKRAVITDYTGVWEHMRVACQTSMTAGRWDFNEAATEPTPIMPVSLSNLVLTQAEILVDRARVSAEQGTNFTIFRVECVFCK